MKYFIFTFIWKNSHMTDWNVQTNVIECKFISDIYKKVKDMPEKAAITSVSEITHVEYWALKDLL